MFHSRESARCQWRPVVHSDHGGKLLVQRALSTDSTILARNMLCSGGIYIHTASVSYVVKRVQISTHNYMVTWLFDERYNNASLVEIILFLFIIFRQKNTGITMARAK